MKLPKIQEKEQSFIKQIKNICVFAEGLISIEQLKDFNLESIKDKSEPSSKFSLTFAKSYIQRVDDLKMPDDYQPPKIQQFDDKYNPKQHKTYFIKTCNNARKYGDYLVKQFI